MMSTLSKVDRMLTNDEKCRELRQQRSLFRKDQKTVSVTRTLQTKGKMLTADC